MLTDPNAAHLFCVRETDRFNLCLCVCLRARARVCSTKRKACLVWCKFCGGKMASLCEKKQAPTVVGQHECVCQCVGGSLVFRCFHSDDSFKLHDANN